MYIWASDLNLWLAKAVCRIQLSVPITDLSCFLYWIRPKPVLLPTHLPWVHTAYDPLSCRWQRSAGQNPLTKLSLCPSVTYFSHGWLPACDLASRTALSVHR